HTKSWSERAQMLPARCRAGGRANRRPRPRAVGRPKPGLGADLTHRILRLDTATRGRPGRRLQSLPAAPASATVSRPPPAALADPGTKIALRPQYRRTRPEHHVRICRQP